MAQEKIVMSNHTNRRGSGPLPAHDKLGYTPQRLQGLSEEDTLFFHNQGNHGNTEMDSPNFNPDLWNPNCPKCKEREARALNRLMARTE